MFEQYFPCYIKKRPKKKCSKIFQIIKPNWRAGYLYGVLDLYIYIYYKFNIYLYIHTSLYYNI